MFIEHFLLFACLLFVIHCLLIVVCRLLLVVCCLSRSCSFACCLLVVVV